jgi:hypothetical protein
VIAIYLALGTLFGITIVKGEMVSWLRIQEMFRFDGFHMYGVLGSAVLVTAIGIRALRRRTAVDGTPITVPAKDFGGGTRYWAGGVVFGLGWALGGACPGPMFALLGAGFTVFLVAIAGALVGAWAYAFLRPRLPH